jgi:GalNAc5-diNAcBac-PP-undecaprenol beta-1,3-glucosyltransferase
MKNEKIMVSIIMATYNRAHLIRETLDSIIAQSYLDWECLIIDDGSSDNTKNIVQFYRNLDHRINFFERNIDYKKGLPGCRNFGLDLASGDYVVFFDDDDIIHRDNLKICVENLRQFPHCYYCRYDKKPFTQKTNPHDMLIGNYQRRFLYIEDIDLMVTGELPFASCTVMWQKECFKDLRFNEMLLYAEEWELYSRILSSGYIGVSINEVLYYNRKHPNSNTGEYWRNDPIRRQSKTKAVSLVIANLKQKKLLSDKLVLYFIRLSFFLKEPSLLHEILKVSNAGWIKKNKYKLGFKFYSFLRPIFLFKNLLKSKFS